MMSNAPRICKFTFYFLDVKNCTEKHGDKLPDNKHTTHALSEMLPFASTLPAPPPNFAVEHYTASCRNADP